MARQGAHIVKDATAPAGRLADNSLPMPKLFARREVTLPTPFGLLVLGLGLALLLATLGLNVARFLAVNEPLSPARAPGPITLAVEGWVNEHELDQVVRLAASGRYRRILTANGPVDGFSTHATYAERAAAYLAPRLPPGVELLAAPSPATLQDRTFVSAVWLRDLAQVRGEPVRALDVATRGVHARRTWAMYRQAFGPEVPVGILALPARDYDPERWWLSSAAFKAVLGEVFALAWVNCCFWPGPAGSDFEFPGLPRVAGSLPAQKP